MVKNTCQCANRTINADSEFNPAEKFPTVRHRRAQMPSILKYRGLDNEAVEAARTIKIETLMATLQAALDDLDLSLVDLPGPETDASQVETKKPLEHAHV